MVAVDEAGRPTPIDPLVPVIESQAQRLRQAVLRKSARLDLIRQLEATEPSALLRPTSTTTTGPSPQSKEN